MARKPAAPRKPRAPAKPKIRKWPVGVVATPAPPGGPPRAKIEAQPIPAPGFTATRWRTPTTGDMLLKVQFANGYVDDSHAYMAHQLRWTRTGSDWDIAAVAEAFPEEPVSPKPIRRHNP